MKMSVNENMAGRVIIQRVPMHDPALEKQVLKRMV